MSMPAAGFARRHVVAVEDHLYHTAEMLETIERVAPELLPCTTVCAIDDPGGDTTAAVTSWLERYETVQVAASVSRTDLPRVCAARLLPLDAAARTELTSFARMVASLLLPSGLLVQDVHLSTLRFIPADRWWESIYLAATVRGMFARRQPVVRFLSNKRGYAATFGRDLMDAGFDPRDVMDKAELANVIVPTLARDVWTRFPLELISSDAVQTMPIAADDDARREIEERLDLVTWGAGNRLELGGRALGAHVTFRPGSQEADIWHQLISDRIAGGTGISISSVGQRLAEPGAERAEMSNLAARHIHALRARLTNPQGIVTANHAYHLDPALVVGLVRGRDGSTSARLPDWPG
jgi:hypothetical protein